METVMLLLVAGLALILSIAAFARHATASVDFEDMKSAFDKGKDDVNALARRLKAAESLLNDVRQDAASVRSRLDAEIGKLHARLTALETARRAPEPQKPKGRKHP